MIAVIDCFECGSVPIWNRVDLAKELMDKHNGHVLCVRKIDIACTINWCSSSRGGLCHDSEMNTNIKMKCKNHKPDRRKEFVKAKANLDNLET